MGYFFVGMAYLFHTLVLDILIAINIFVINNLLVKHYNRSFFNLHKGNKLMIGCLVFFDILSIFLLYYFDLLMESSMILLAEVTIIGLGAAIVWFVMVNVDTWFKYIC
jgi:hypothetical protein